MPYKHNRHPRMHIHFADSTHNGARQTSPTSKKHHNYRLAEHKAKLHSDIRPYWSYRDDLAVIDGVIMKGRHIIIPVELKQQMLDQLHLNHMGIEKMKLLMQIGLLGQY